MILLFDVGNTNISIGISDGQDILETYRLNTDVSKTADEYYVQLRNILGQRTFEKLAIASVVPRITESLKEISKRYYGIPQPLLVGPGIKTGINIKTDHPREVGADIICDAAAVLNQRPHLIIDLGTANKYIYIKNKTILGVVITPGVHISIKALVGNTALLPDIEIEVPKKVLGTNTISCMQSGVTYGVAAQVDGLIEQIKEEVNESFDVILTGGLSSTIAPLCRYPMHRDPDWVLKGLLTIVNKNSDYFE